MQMLVLGIDGGDLDIIKQFDMPFTHDLIRKNKSLLLEEDLFDRGWMKILAGQKGVETGAFYMRPKLDGTFNFTTSFNTKNLEGRSDVKFLWDILEDLNKTYCIMNVPTTTPVPNYLKKGIVIGSAGGGLNVVNGIPESLVSRDDIRKMLVEDGYVIDIRIPNNEISETASLFEQLIQMEKKRTSCFIKICQKDDVDFGFLVDRGTTIVQYLARNVIEKIKVDGRDKVSESKDGWALELLERYYRSLDENIKDLFEELKPDSFIITADHNTVPHLKKACVEPFLIKNGFLHKTARTKRIGVIKGIIDKIGLLPLARKLIYRKSNLGKPLVDRYDKNSTIAFGSNYVSGIYINDYRFTNVINTKELYEETLNNLIRLFNDLSESERLGMVASPYRSRKFGEFKEFLPDIIFLNSEGIHFDDSGPSFSYINENYFSNLPMKLSEVRHAAHSGDKGKNPIMIFSPNLNEVECQDSSDLRVVYELIQGFFEK